MNRFLIVRICRWMLPVVVAASIAGALPARGGTPIQFPGEPPSPLLGIPRPASGIPIVFPFAAPLEVDPEPDLEAKPWASRVGEAALPQYQPPAQGSSSRSPRLSAARLEQLRRERISNRFWLFEKPKEQGKNDTDAKFGVRQYSYEDIANPSPNPDPTFKNVMAREPKTPPVGERSVAFGHAEESAPSSLLAADRQYGAQATPEISIQEFLAPLPSAAAEGTENQSAFSMADLLDLPRPTQGTPAQVQEESLALPGLPQSLLGSDATRDAGGSASVGPRAPMNPLAGSPAGSSEGPPRFTIPGAGTASPLPPANSIPYRSSPVGQPSRITGFSSLPPPAYSPPRQPTFRVSPFSPEPPRRRF